MYIYAKCSVCEALPGIQAFMRQDDQISRKLSPICARCWESWLVYPGTGPAQRAQFLAAREAVHQKNVQDFLATILATTLATTLGSPEPLSP